MTLSDNEAFINEVKHNRLSDSSKIAYNNYGARFLCFLIENNELFPNCLSDDFCQQLRLKGIEVTKEYLNFSRQWIHEHLTNQPPVQYDNLTLEVFTNWIASLKLSDGKRLGKSSYNTCRSAFRYLFRIYNITFPSEMDVKLKEMYTGLKKTVAKRRGRGEEHINSGKDNLEFTFYKAIAFNLLKSNRKEDAFAHFFILLCWNLLS